jgi:hypothetical protein
MGDLDVVAGEPARLILDAVCGLRRPIEYGELRYRPGTPPDAMAAMRRAIDRVAVDHGGEENYARITRYGLGDELRMHLLVDVLEQRRRTPTSIRISSSDSSSGGACGLWVLDRQSTTVWRRRPTRR